MPVQVGLHIQQTESAIRPICAGKLPMRATDTLELYVKQEPCEFQKKCNKCGICAHLALVFQLAAAAPIDANTKNATCAPASRETGIPSSMSHPADEDPGPLLALLTASLPKEDEEPSTPDAPGAGATTQAAQHAPQVRSHAPKLDANHEPPPSGGKSPGKRGAWKVFARSGKQEGAKQKVPGKGKGKGSVHSVHVETTPPTNGNVPILGGLAVVPLDQITNGHPHSSNNSRGGSGAIACLYVEHNPPFRCLTQNIAVAK